VAGPGRGFVDAPARATYPTWCVISVEPQDREREKEDDRERGSPMKRNLTARSSKKEIFDELARLERLVQETGQRLAVAERERQDLREENEQLRERSEFIERLRRELATVNEKLDLLTRVTKDLNSLNPDKIFDVCVTKIPFLLNARYASIYVYEQERQKLLLKKHSHGRPIDRIIDLEKNPHSLMARVLESKKVRIFPDLERTPEPNLQNLTRPNAAGYTTRSCIIAPLCAADRVLGVLNLADRLDGRSFSPGEDLAIVQQIADLLAVALRNYGLFEKLKRQAKTDSLTKLANHQTFFDELAREVTRAARYKADLSIIMIDIDGFKVINDNLGHLAGDRVLEEVARILRENIRNVDTAARYGGDEFALLLPEQDVRGAIVVAERIRGRMRSHAIVHDGNVISIRMSMGVAQYRQGETTSELVKAADDSLYQAKRDGGDKVFARE